MSSPPSAPKFQIEDGHEDEGRMAKKFRDSPLMVAGMVGWVGIVGYGIYGIKNRKTNLAMHLIHTRVIAQACVVAALSLGVGYNIYKEHFSPYMGWSKKPDHSDSRE